MNNINQKTPEGWSVKKISDLGNVVSGGTPDTNNPEYWDGNVLWVTPSEVSTLSNRFISNTERKITEKGLKESSAKLLPINSLIICTRATIGDCCINKVPMCTNQGFKNIIVKNNNVDFLYYLITKNKNELIRKACGSTFLEISKKDIDNLKFAIPPLPEQEKIALVLGTWDEAIEKLSNLIEQKKLLKKGLMQKLLTGKTRLSTFTQPWKEVKLGEICNITTGKLDANAMVENGQYKFFTCAKETYLIDNYAFNTEALLISGNGANVGYIHYYKGKFNAYQRTYVLDKFTLNIFLVKYLLDQFLSNRIEKEKKAGNTPYIVLDTLAKMKLYLPSDISEQQAIADVLSTADDEINLLNQKLEALKEQKKGLMQQLLTGKIRVKVN